jgi:hypothetical protein
MGSIYVPKLQVQSVEVGTTAISNPLIFIKLNGIIYANGSRIDIGGGYRDVYGTYDPATGKVYLTSYTFAVSGTVPASSFSNVEVLLIG